MATFYLVGQAQILCQLFYDEEGDLNWEEFCNRLYERFGPSKLENFTRRVSEAPTNGNRVRFTVAVRDLVEQNQRHMQGAEEHIFYQWTKGTN